ncbi:MAG: hypothetical protein ACRD3N_06325 [Terracidiphilus sp.]
MILPILFAAAALPCLPQPPGQPQPPVSFRGAHGLDFEAQAAEPDAPHPQSAAPPVAQTAIGFCQLRDAGAALSASASASALAASGLVPPSAAGAAPPVIKPAPCLRLQPVIDWYARFLNGPQVKPLTPGEKGWLAIRNLVDPFNLVTIVGNAAIAVGANSHSAYGPGMAGLGEYTGVSFTQDAIGEFFGTFAIPSIAHQDPHYHRMPHAAIPRRIVHAIVQVAWTQGDNGRGMVNYADLAGFAIDDEISDLYVPGQRTNLPSSAKRYVYGLATAPADNFITEFLPDVARHIHVNVVIVQRIINRVATTNGEAGP